MNRLVILLACALSAAPLLAAERAVGKVLSGGDILNLSLIEALAAIDHADMAGVFAFIPEEQSPMAMADLLLRNHKALRRFIKKAEKDAAKADAISDWDKQVCLYLTGMLSQGQLPPGLKAVSPRWLGRIHELSLKPGLPLQMIVQKRDL